ncbi:transcriptional regulator [Actinomadura sp. 7K534]|uniref:transcriptional regulator n=1 Tax=Actinomadura sp. 7K534 TaxID=2530366 RepID=UPI001FB5C952|nr:transcriptional regulator [Actinomadura sp. 7K534]
MVHVLQLPIEELGFTPPWETADTPAPARPNTSTPTTHGQGTGAALPLPKANAAVQPPTVGADFSAINGALRRLYFSVQPAQLHPTVVEHTKLGTQLLAETTGVPRTILATALAESLLLVGRIEFFDLRQPEDADASYVRALQAAGEADDPLLGAAILAHAAFIPGWDGRRDEAAERMRAARTYARRGNPPAEFWAWLDAVEAECETRCGHPREALRLIDHAERMLAESTGAPAPDWFNWFSPVSLASFKGDTQLKAGQPAQAKATLLGVLEAIGDTNAKQRAVILGDLAAVEVAQRNPEAACTYAEQALDQLAVTWYATGMDRVHTVRRALQPWADTDCVRRLDDRLYGWQTTLSALQR